MKIFIPTHQKLTENDGFPFYIYIYRRNITVTYVLPAEFSVLSAELTAINLATSLANDLCLQRITIFTDPLRAIQSINFDHTIVQDMNLSTNPNIGKKPSFLMDSVTFQHKGKQRS